MLNHLSLGLQGRLVLIALVAFLPALLHAVYAHQEQRRLARQVAEQQAVGVVRRVAASQERAVTRAIVQAETLADVPMIRNATADRCSRYLAQVMKRQAELFANITRVAPDGAVLCSAVPVDSGMNVAQNPGFQQRLTAGRPMVSDYMYGPIVKSGVVSVTAPVLGEQREVLGLVGISIDLRWLRKAFVDAEVPVGTQLTLLDQHGTVLARFPEKFSVTGTKVPESRAILDAARLQPRGGILALPQSREQIYAFHRLLNEEAGGMLIYAAVPKATVYATADAQLQRNVLSLALVLLLMLTGTVLASRRLVVQPVRQLQMASQRLSQGDLEARAEMRPGRDEVSNLGQIFNRMAQSLQAREAALRERTAQVERLNRAYAVLSGVNGLILRGGEKAEMLKEACRIAVEQGGFLLAWIGLMDRRRQCFESVQAAGGEDAAAVLVPAPASFVEDRPEIEAMLSRGQPALYPERGQTPYWQGRVRKDYTSCIALPLHHDDAMAGCIVLHLPWTHVVDEAELRLLKEMAADISHALRHLEQARRLNVVSVSDLLTGLPNASVFRDRLAFALEVVAPDSGHIELALILVSLHGLRRINSVHGLHVGDKVIRWAAERISSLLPPESTVARLRSGTFGIILSQRQQSDVVMRTIERILDEFDAPFSVDGAEISLAVRLGISMWPLDGQDPDVLLQHAETAVSSAAERPEKFCFFVPQLQQRAETRLALEGQLHHAIKSRELYLRYQPIVSVESRKIIGVEALVRWRHPQQGHISPASFIPVAEASGLMIPLGEWIIAEAFAQARRWTDAGIPDIKVAVNVAASQVKHPGFLEGVDKALRKCKVPPQKLALGIELTEGELMEDTPRTIELLHQLKARGFSLSIDDFGTGYSCLAYLERFPVDTLKIDIAFIKDVNRNSSIAQSIIALAENLGLSTVAEGVETPEQFRKLVELGCDAVQGHLFGTAMPAEKIADMAGKPLAVEEAQRPTSGA